MTTNIAGGGMTSAVGRLRGLPAGVVWLVALLVAAPAATEAVAPPGGHLAPICAAIEPGTLQQGEAPVTAETPGPPPDWARGVARVGGRIKPPTKRTHVSPVYPKAAQDASVQGTVILEARVETDGHIRNVRVVRSIAELDQAALDAVRQWEFAPMRLGGRLVPVIMTICIRFSLSERVAAWRRPVPPLVV
jgi:protein TonB